jgi:hypothetical protein
MRWVRAVPRFVEQLAERHVWLFVAASVVFWTVLSPLALVWLVLFQIDRYRALDKHPEAKRARRVARLLRWYPAGWRARYGEEMAALLHDTIAAGGDGPRLGWNLAREGMATRVAPPARRQGLAAACLSLCWLPLVPQGLVAATIKAIGSPTRSWFLALHLPEPYQWPSIAAMIATGLAMLAAGVTLAQPPAARLPE